MTQHLRPIISITVVTLIFSLGLINLIHPLVQLTPITIYIDGHGSSRSFDGVGALSAGGTSRLLIDYPPQQQQQILDYLFKPGYGANLQILKVEIGGDTDTTEGAEASTQRTPTDQNYNRGYEWWLMEQAKARNSNIKLYGLEWGAPGWFKGGFWSQDNINYIINWLKHAQSDHQLPIDYIGGWNEKGYNKIWYENLKKALHNNGLTTKIVADDNTGNDEWAVTADMQNDPTFNQATDIVGEHYPCTNKRSITNPCLSDPDAQSLNKPIWQSEAGSGNYDTGTATLAQTITHGYIDDRITATINRSLLDAGYTTLAATGNGLMQANQPWSGKYLLGKSLWVVAQITQFTQPGWQFIDSASGYLRDNPANGSYVSLKSANSRDYSIYIETTPATTAQTVSFQITNGLSTGTVHVWATNLKSSKASDWFVHQQDITPNNGSFSLTLQPNHVYSLTTTSGQGKGTATSPASSQLKLSYTDNFESYTVGQIPHYFSTISGAYEAAPCTGKHTGMCMRQMITTSPIISMKNPDPLTLVGDPSWTNYQVSMDTLMEHSGYIDLIGGISKQSNSHVNGYHLRIANTGRWRLFKETASGHMTSLASGKTSFGLNTWHHLTLRVQAGTIQASIDNTPLADVNDSSYLVGQTGIQAAHWINVQIDNFTVTPLTND